MQAHGLLAEQLSVHVNNKHSRKEQTMKSETVRHSDPETRQQVRPLFDDQHTSPPRRRRHWLRNILVFAALALIVAGAVGVYQRIAGQTQPTLSQPGQTV